MQQESAVLWTIDDWKTNWRCSEDRCQKFRKDPEYPRDCEVYLGPRAVRFRADKLAEFAKILAARKVPLPQPEYLRRGAEAHRAELRREKAEKARKVAELAAGNA